VRDGYASRIPGAAISPSSRVHLATLSTAGSRDTVKSSGPTGKPESFWYGSSVSAERGRRLSSGVGYEKHRGSSSVMKRRALQSVPADYYDVHPYPVYPNSLEGLLAFLETFRQLEEYKVHVYDCSEMTAYLEWRSPGRASTRTLPPVLLRGPRRICGRDTPGFSSGPKMAVMRLKRRARLLRQEGLLAWWTKMTHMRPGTSRAGSYWMQRSMIGPATVDPTSSIGGSSLRSVVLLHTRRHAREKPHLIEH